MNISGICSFWRLSSSYDKLWWLKNVAYLFNLVMSSIMSSAPKMYAVFPAVKTQMWSSLVLLIELVKPIASYRDDIKQIYLPKLKHLQVMKRLSGIAHLQLSWPCIFQCRICETENILGIKNKSSAFLYKRKTWNIVMKKFPFNNSMHLFSISGVKPVYWFYWYSGVQACLQSPALTLST